VSEASEKRRAVTNKKAQCSALLSSTGTHGDVAKSREGRNFTSQQESNVAASMDITKENGTHREISF
jgi:hypothetical protein